MRKFSEWIELRENMHFGRPHGQMGPDGKVYGHSSGPVSRVPGTNTWASIPAPKSPSVRSEEEKIWKSNSSLVRLAYLSGFPNAEQLGLHMVSWDQLPPEAQEAARKEMNSKSPFG